MSQELLKQLLIEEGIVQSEDQSIIADIVNSEDQEEQETDNIFDTINDIFDGTKRTQYVSMPEIGEAKLDSLGQSAKVTAGLLLTPNQESQADIIKASIPGSAIREDKYGNPIVALPDGRAFYLNKPGASFQDFIQTTGQILSYIPGYSMVAKKLAKSYFKKIIAQTAVAGGTSVAQDLAAKQLGATTTIDAPKLVTTMAATGLFETGVPVLQGLFKVMQRLRKAKKYVKVGSDGKTILSQKGREALEAAGVDPSTASDDFIKKFFERYGSGVGDDLAKARTEAEFGIDMAASQTGLAKDKVSLANLYEATKGTFGETAQIKAIEFFSKQNIQIKESFEKILERFNKGQIDTPDLESAGARILDSVRKGFQSADDKVQTAYNQVDKKAIFTGGGSNIKVLTNSVRKNIMDSVGSLDPKVMPGTAAALRSLDDLVKLASKKNPKEIDQVIFDTFEKRRMYINDLINAAKKEGGPDYRALINVKKAYDKFMSDMIDNTLFSGKKSALKAIGRARKAVVDRERLYGLNPIVKNGFVIRDKAGEVLQKIINDPDITPLEVINYAIGAKKIGVGQTPLKVIRRLKKVIGIENPAKGLGNKDFVGLRTAVFDRVLSNAIINNKFVPGRLVKEFDEIFKGNKEFMDELFTKGEQQNLRRLVEVIRKTLEPKDLANLSNTGSVLARALQQAGRGVVGAAALKTGGINFLLATRNAFDRAVELFTQRKGRDLALSQIGDKTTDILSAARSGLQGKRPGLNVNISGPSIPFGGGKTFTPQLKGDIGLTPTVTGGANQLVGQSLDRVKAPQIQDYEMKNNQQSSVPTLDRNMFASLFPTDTLGTAISERKRG